MVVFPNAKINLGLRVIRKRYDGFHDIESLFYPIGLSDVLEILPVGNGQEAFFMASGLEVPVNEGNLCIKALSLLQSKYTVQALGIYLHKVIPPGGGLGGGSSDGAYTLKSIDRLLDLELSREKLLEYAGELGSDCPFFIENTPSLVTGRGEKLQPLPACLGGYYLILVIPDIRISTTQAYSMVNPFNDGEPVGDIVRLPPEKWQGRLVNDFEAPLFSEYPELRAIRDRLYGSGAIYASMTGSGSGIYGIYNEQPAMPPELERYFVYTEILK